MLRRLKLESKICIGIVLFCAALAFGCYQQPSADKIQYDAEAVETIRQQVKDMDWE